MSYIDTLARNNQIKLSLRSESKQKNGLVVKLIPELYDTVAQCPKCKTIETLQFIEDMMLPCRKFLQRDGYIYHVCGSDQPCRLYR